MLLESAVGELRDDSIRLGRGIVWGGKVRNSARPAAQYLPDGFNSLKKWDERHL